MVLPVRSILVKEKRSNVVLTLTPPLTHVAARHVKGVQRQHGFAFDLLRWRRLKTPGVPIFWRESREDKTLVPATRGYCTKIHASFSKEKNDLNFRCRVHIWTVENTIDDIHRSYANNYKVLVKLKPAKTSGLNGIRTHDLCVTGAVLYPYYVHTKRFASA